MKKLYCYLIVIFVVLFLSSCSQAIYTVTFDTVDGSQLKYIQVRHGDKIPTPTTPYQEGYTFNGWSYNGEIWNFKLWRVKSDMTLRAVWSANLYEVSFDSDGGDYVAPVIEEYRTRITLPKITKQGMNFYGWEYNNKIVSVLDVPANNVTIKAVWDVDYKLWSPFLEIIRKYKGSEEYVVIPSYYILDNRKMMFTTIEEGCFLENEIIKEVVIPEGIKQINNGAFMGSASLEKVNIPNTVEKIDHFVFNGTNLKEVVIPSSVTEVGFMAFYSNNIDFTIYIDLESKPSGWNDNWCYGNANIYWKDQWTYNEQGQPVPIK